MDKQNLDHDMDDLNHVMNDSITTLKSYIYLDEPEINGLYSQLYEDVIEQTISVGRKSSNSVDGTIGGTAFGIIKAEGTFEHSNDKDISDEIKTHISVQRKANILVSHVCNNHIPSLQSLIVSANASGSLMRGRIIVGYGVFALTALWDADDKIVDLSKLGHNFNVKSSTLVLESGNTNNIHEMAFDLSVSHNQSHDVYDQPYKILGKYGIEMWIGGDKMRRELRHLTNSITRGKTFHLVVLGQLTWVGGQYYSIKPFAIW